MNKLKQVLREAGITQLEIIKVLNIKSLSTINLKINGKAEFTTREAIILKNFINTKTKNNYSLEDLFLEDKRVCKW